MPRRWIAWWYTAIAAGFVLLAMVHLMSRDREWLVAVRLVIAAGFGLLATMEFRARRRK